MNGYVVPPLRFATVHDRPGLYRGAYPRKINLTFFERLKLRCVLSVTPEPLEPEVATWFDGQGIERIHIKCEKASKKGIFSHDLIVTVLGLMIQQEKAPMYVHCINGEEITSIIIGCLRKIDYWSLPDLISEISRFIDGTPPSSTITFLEKFTCEINIPHNVVNWLWRGVSEPGAVIAKHPFVSVTYADEKKQRRSQELCLRSELAPT